MHIDPSTTKYLIRGSMSAEGIVEKPDVVGAIFGQTEGLVGDELDLRDLQKSGRVGRIEVELKSVKGKSEGEIVMPSSLDQVETAIMAAALETIDRIGPCKATVRIIDVEDVRAAKKKHIVDRARELLVKIMEDSKAAGIDLTETVRQSVQIQEISLYGKDKCPAGPHVATSDAIIVVEGRSDVLNLLKYGIKNAIAVEGTSIKQTIRDISKERTVTSFVDGDRGGELILKELLQVAEVDFVARAPRGAEVEELTQKQIMKALRNKMPAEQFIEMYNLGTEIKLYQDTSDMDAPDVARGARDDKRGVTGASATTSRRAKEERVVKERNGRDRPPAATAPAAPGPAPAPADAKPSKKELKVSPEQKKLKETLASLANSLKATMLNSKGVSVKEVQVRELAESLKKPPADVDSIVFDGVITQRLVDLAAEHSIHNLVGIKMGAVARIPTTVNIFTRADFEE